MPSEDAAEDKGAAGVSQRSGLCMGAASQWSSDDLDSRHSGTIVPLFCRDGISYAQPARMADRAVPVDFGRFLALIHSPLDPASRQGRGHAVDASPTPHRLTP